MDVLASATERAVRGESKIHLPDDATRRWWYGRSPFERQLGSNEERIGCGHLSLLRSAFRPLPAQPDEIARFTDVLVPRWKTRKLIPPQRFAGVVNVVKASRRVLV